ncbi:DDE domain protein [Candidatus Methanoperedenaceae archaeon GB50]|nr:DDE domain protein [Candidatus Methanoperedenaceae archaeon GB37]CAD7768308.1 DDE domain protein [Candidatus Methanoperedenaceae archaeon GB50]CAD7771072.1 DDE domain protein [Candidatus Methanoperedenaceae archaeon GB37]CAD7772051.1 DDE domain protein [Candidatus Methanoperedenaceae archaeon GB37]CAD7772139.1 DDE domain protein [Candidatus Methanoperedenaceae archaeon GB50]
MGDYLLFMLRVREIVEELKVFERNKVPFEVKVLGVATYIQTSSVRRTARILSELHPVSKTSVWNWIRKFEEKLPVVSEKKRRYSIALDETVVKSNKKAYYVYSAVDVEKNELILMRVYTNRNYLVSRSFLKEVLKFCENKPRFIVDKAPWLIDALKSLDLEFEHQTFRREKPG